MTVRVSGYGGGGGNSCSRRRPTRVRSGRQPASAFLLCRRRDAGLVKEQHCYRAVDNDCRQADLKDPPGRRMQDRVPGAADDEEARHGGGGCPHGRHGRVKGPPLQARPAADEAWHHTLHYTTYTSIHYLPQALLLLSRHPCCVGPIRRILNLLNRGRAG